MNFPQVVKIWTGPTPVLPKSNKFKPLKFFQLYINNICMETKYQWKRCKGPQMSIETLKKGF